MKKENYPSQDAINDAEEFLRKRLSAELSMTNNLSYYLREGAEQIVDACREKNVSVDNFSFYNDIDIYNKVEEVIAWIKEMVTDACITLAESSDTKSLTEEEQEEYINRDVDGDNFDSRLLLYLGTFRSEMEDFTKYALATTSAVKWSKNWKGYSHKGMSAFNSLNRLTRSTIASTWMHSLYEDLNEQDGCIGYYVMRGSSYPCDTCDAMVGFHPITDTDGVPPYHAHCCCIMVPVTL